MAPTGYAKKAQIPIAPSSDGALTNFQVKLTLVKGAGTNVAGTIYLNNNALNWPYDVRFTNADGDLLDFWREEYDVTDGTWHVEIDSIPTGDNTVLWVYYGKSGDTDASSVYSTFIAPSDDFRYPAWQTKRNMPWSIADETAEVYNGKIYVIGGYNSGSSDEKTTIQEYDPSDDSWTAKTAMTTGRWGPMAVQIGGNIHVFGGDKDGVAQVKHEIYNIAGDSWSTGTDCPSAIGHQGIYGCSDGTDIYLAYGTYLYKYDVSEGTFTLLNSSIPDYCSWGVMSYYNGSLYILTGYKQSGTVGACADVRIYNIAGDSWSTGTDCPYNVFGAARENVILGDKIYIIHGQGAAGHFYSFVLVYDISEDSWTEMSPGPYGDDGCAGSFLDGKYYVFGGRKDLTGPYGTNGVSVYDPANDVEQTRWDWINCGVKQCPDDGLYVNALSAWAHAGARSKSTVDTDNTWIEFDFTPTTNSAEASAQNIEVFNANDDISIIYFYFYRNKSTQKMSLYTRQSGSGGVRWTSANTYAVGTTYHAKIKDLGTSCVVYLQTAAGVDIENSGSVNYDTVTQKLQFRAGNTADAGTYAKFIIRKYTANDPAWATPGSEESSDSEVSIAVGAASVALSPASIGLEYAKSIDVSPASVELGASAISLEKGASVDVSPAAIELSAQAVGLEKALSLAISPASIAIAAQDIELSAGGQVEVEVSSGSILLAPQEITTQAARELAIEQAGIELAAQAVTAQVGQLVEVSGSAIEATAQSIALEQAISIAVDAASIALTPQDIAVSTGGSVEITVSPAAIEISPSAAGLERITSLDIATSEIGLAASTIGTEQGKILAVSPAAVEISPSAIGLVRPLSLAVGQAAIEIAAQDIELSVGGSTGVDISPASVEVISSIIGLTQGKSISVAPASVELDPVALTLQKAKVLSVESAEISVLAGMVGLESPAGLVIDPAGVEFTAQEVSTEKGAVVLVDPAQIEAAPQAIGLWRSISLTVEPAAIEIEAQDIGLDATIPGQVDIDQADIIIITSPIEAGAGYGVVVAVAAISLTPGGLVLRRGCLMHYQGESLITNEVDGSSIIGGL